MKQLVSLLALVAGVSVPPSMLVLWDRWHRRRGEAAIDVAATTAAFDEELPTHGRPIPEGAGGA